MSYIYPTNLPVSSPYGQRSSGFHCGIDFSNGIAGHEIHAIGDGEVTYKAYEEGGFGNTLTITHADGTKSGYGHMMGPAIVNEGDRVHQGQVIGYVGSTGHSDGPHVHLWMGSLPIEPGAIDPTPLLNGTPTQGDEELSAEDRAIIGQWMQDDRELYGRWMQEQSSNVVKILGDKLDKIIELLSK